VIGPGRSGPLAVLAAGALLASTWAAISHSESSAHAGPLVVLDVVHLVATAVWLGGLVVLGFAILREADLDVARAAVSRFSTAAAWSVVVLVSTGCVQAWQRVGSMSALTDNDYALLLAVKVALVAMTLGLAGFARFRMVPRQPAQLGQLRRLVLVELGFGIAVLTVTSVLVNTEPARTAHAQLIAAERAARPVGQAAVRPAALRAGSLSGVVPYDAAVGTTGRGTIQVTVAPAAVGSTEIHLSVLDSANTPRPVEKLSVALRPTGALGQQPIPVAFTEISPGHYVSRGAWFPAAGSWQLGIALRLSGDAAAVAVAGIAVT
jgi:copper transport protein